MMDFSGGPRQAEVAGPKAYPVDPVENDLERHIRFSVQGRTGEVRIDCQAVTQAFVSGCGGYHTAHPESDNPRPYATVTPKQITTMIETPPSVAKDQAQWMIPSATNGEYARVHEFQREMGQFYALWADLDKVEGLTFLDVQARIKQALPGTAFLAYTTRSATENNPRCRVLIFLAIPIPGKDFSTISRILNNRLEAVGLPPDRATERPGQLCYLPNRGEYYQHLILEGEPLNPDMVFSGEIQAEQERLKAEAAELEARHLESLQKIQARIDSGQADPVEAFKAAYPLELALERYGNTRHGNKWISRNSESGKPGISVKDGKWISHHESDAGIGQPAQGGGTWGDAFDLFVYYEHGGDFNRAVQAAGEMFTTTDPLNGQTVTLSKLNQRQHMRAQEDGTEKDFQGETTTPGATGFKKAQAKPDTWEPIIPLDAQEVDLIDPNTLPGIIGEYAQAVARETETPLELSAGMLFVVIAACVQGLVRIQVKPGYSEPLPFWTVTPLDPANRKSQVLKRVTGPLTAWERRKRAEFEPLIKARRIDRDNIQARIKVLRGKYGKAKAGEMKGIENEIYDLENKLMPELVSPQIWAQDCTPENAGQIMARNQERLTILAAEGGILDTLGGRYSSGVANLDLFLQGYSGDAVKVNRTSRDDIYLNSPALSMGLMPQPQVIRGMAAKPEFKGRGFNGRPLYFKAESNLGSRTLDSEPIPERLKIAYAKVIEKLLDIKPIEHPDGTTEAHVLTLSPEAFQEWRDFYMTIEKDLADGGRFEHCRDWAGKTPGRAARLAGLFHCAMNPVEPWLYPVSFETMNQALDVTAASCSHALAIFNLMGADPAIEGAGRVLHWITRHRRQTITKRDCFQALRGTYTRSDMLDEPLAVLVERNYIRPMIEIEKKPGRKSEVYQVNPGAFQGGEHGLA